MLLQILVPQYNESDTVIKSLLDSIMTQQNIDFNEISVLICNDGSDVLIDENRFSSYPYQIEYFKEPHKGISAVRNFLLQKATSEYVMFCDADDMFYHNLALCILFQEAFKGNDVVNSNFIKHEVIGNTFQYVTMQQETYIHGKMYRRAYLLEKNIWFEERLHVHEDSYFNILAFNCTEKKTFIESPFYLWRWRADSVSRNSPTYMLETFTQLLDSSRFSIRTLTERGMEGNAAINFVAMVLDTFYYTHEELWRQKENKQQVKQILLYFKEYWLENKTLWDVVPDSDKFKLSTTMRGKHNAEIMVLETSSVDAWIKKVEKLK